MKKLLISSDNAFAHYYIRLGIGRVFSAMGWDVTLWDINKKPALDAFDDIEPDIFIGQTYNVNRALYTAIKERPNLKVVMKASDWGPMVNKIDLNKYPILVANQQEKEIIINLRYETGKPDYVDIHYHPNYIEDTHGYWSKNGVPIHSRMSAADVFDYTNGKFFEEYKSDICFIGGYWPYKSLILNKYLIPLCNLNNDYNIKIFGNQQWPVAQYCGFIGNEKAKDVLASASICPNLHEPHSHAYGFDVIERPFKLLSNRCFVISDYVDGLSKIFNEDEIVYAKNEIEFKKLIDHYLNQPDERNRIAINGYNRTIKEHTYFHRVRDMLIRLNMEEEAEHCMSTFELVKERLGLCVY